MEPLVTFSAHDAVGVIAINNPPVNALSSGVPKGIRTAVLALEKDPGVRAIVVIGGGRTFVAGADIHEFVAAVSGHGSMPSLHPALFAIEDCPKPVVMAIHGTALGGGLELAMAGHYRVATPDAQVGQPEVKIGLIPGAGGTQRLPRLAGVAKAAEMCALGESVGAREALDLGILDKIIDGDLLTGAKAFALEVAGRPPVRTRDRNEKLAPAESALDALREQCRKTRRNLRAPLAALDAVEAAVSTPFEEGLMKEAEIFERCMFSDQCKGLVHAFFGERAVAKVPDIPKDTPVFPIRKAAVIGAGTMGGGIAMALANAGIPVRIRDSDQAALDRGMAIIAKNYER